MENARLAYVSVGTLQNRSLLRQVTDHWDLLRRVEPHDLGEIAGTLAKVVLQESAHDGIRFERPIGIDLHVHVLPLLARIGVRSVVLSG